MSATAGLGAHRISLAVALSLFISLFAVSAASAARPDNVTDNDGSGANDCAPLDPAVHPGAVDKPDPAGEDTNCDGIDGDKAKAIFVSPGGNNGGTGSLTNPKQTLGGATGAILTAKAANKDVYLAGGTYNETALLEDNVGLFGGYEPITGERDGALTTIKGAPAVLAQGDSGVVLQTLTLDGQQDGSGNAYGLRAIKDGADPSRLVLEKVDAKGAPIVGNSGGFNGGSGFFGFGSSGGGGGGGGCGNGVLGLFGGGGFGLGGAGGGLFVPTGGNGGTGGTGGNGGNGALATPDSAAWTRSPAVAGAQGQSGGGGGGGRGGTGASFLSALCGGQGASGGNGGGGGFPGGGGLAGGGSFGAYLLDSSIVGVSSKLAGGSGGSGGNGGSGGSGGGGTGPGGIGTGGCETLFFTTICAGNGFTGGLGGSGGGGGGGGGGTGGPSTGVYQAGPGSGYADNGTTEQAGTAGQGGLTGNGSASRASSGQSQAILRSGTAPTTSTADFDDDGINDNADACPDQARGASGSANGCPARAAKLADSDGDGVPNTKDGCPSVAASEASDPDNDGCPPVVQPPVVQPPVVQPPVITPPGGGGLTVLPSTTSINSRAFSKFTKLTNLSVKNLLAGTTVTVTCKTKSKKQQKKGCAYKSKRFTTSGARAQLNLRKPFARKKVPVGTRITITIVAPGSIGKQISYTIRARKLPKSRVLCVPPGGKAGNCA